MNQKPPPTDWKELLGIVALTFLIATLIYFMANAMLMRW